MTNALIILPWFLAMGFVARAGLQTGIDRAFASAIYREHHRPGWSLAVLLIAALAAGLWLISRHQDAPTYGVYFLTHVIPYATPAVVIGSMALGYVIGVLVRR